MPAKLLNGFEPPSLENRLWRYMSFSKFAALLLDQKLYFARADTLGDEFEMAIPKMVAAEFKKHAATLPPEGQQSEREFHKSRWMNLRKLYYMSCWHTQEHESAAMWKNYGQFDDCVAIQTTCDRLVNALPEFIVSGMVKYFDDNTEKFELFDGFNSVMHKRKWYLDEREFRAFIWNHGAWPKDNEEEFWIIGAMRNLEPGVSVKIDLAALIEKIYVGPKAPPMLDRLCRMLADGTNLSAVPIERSAMAGVPIFDIEDNEQPTKPRGIAWPGMV